VTHGELGSTNVEALEAARGGERGPLWITAGRQTAGRGRHGRSWISERGNLHASLLLALPAPAERWPQLSFAASLAVHDAIVSVARELEPRLAIKWPNDVLLDGAKLAGILLESQGGIGDEPGAVAIGIGINCASHPPVTCYPATDLSAARVSPATLFAALSISMVERLAQWNAGRGFAAIRVDWLARAAGLGTDMRVRLADRDLLGRFETIDEAGGLLLRLTDGTVASIAAGEVFPSRTPGPRRVELIKSR
jgi:BirA family transcriptional regulator, biotin operon repressor / biotin---[acetyl-CoA-carboxylase] ligase